MDLYGSEKGKYIVNSGTNNKNNNPKDHEDKDCG